MYDLPTRSQVKEAITGWQRGFDHASPSPSRLLPMHCAPICKVMDQSLRNCSICTDVHAEARYLGRRLVAIRIVILVFGRIVGILPAWILCDSVNDREYYLVYWLWIVQSD